MLSLKDRIFRKFCILLNSIRKESRDQSSFLGRLFGESVLTLMTTLAVEERWALFLHSLEIHYSRPESFARSRSSLEDEIFGRYDEFQKEIKLALRPTEMNRGIFMNPLYLVILGNASSIEPEYLYTEKDSNLAQTYFAEALRLDRKCASGYISEAWRLIRIKTFSSQSTSDNTYKRQALIKFREGMRLLGLELSMIMFQLNSLHRRDESDLSPLHRQLVERGDVLQRYLQCFENVVTQIKKSLRLINITQHTINTQTGVMNEISYYAIDSSSVKFYGTTTIGFFDCVNSNEIRINEQERDAFTHYSVQFHSMTTHTDLYVEVDQAKNLCKEFLSNYHLVESDRILEVEALMQDPPIRKNAFPQLKGMGVINTQKLKFVNAQFTTSTSKLCNLLDNSWSDADSEMQQILGDKKIVLGHLSDCTEFRIEFMDIDLGFVNRFPAKDNEWVSLTIFVQKPFEFPVDKMDASSHFEFEDWVDSPLRSSVRTINNESPTIQITKVNPDRKKPYRARENTKMLVLSGLCYKIKAFCAKHLGRLAGNHMFNYSVHSLNWFRFKNLLLEFSKATIRCDYGQNWKESRAGELSIQMNVANCYKEVLSILKGYGLQISLKFDLCSSSLFKKLLEFVPQEHLKLDKKELSAFYLEKYRPTEILEDYQRRGMKYLLTVTEKVSFGFGFGFGFFFFFFFSSFQFRFWYWFRFWFLVLVPVAVSVLVSVLIFLIFLIFFWFRLYFFFVSILILVSVWIFFF
jgi:hypothetical protein